MNNTDTVVTHLPRDTKQRLKALCEENASTISQTLRFLIKKYLEENENRFARPKSRANLQIESNGGNA